MKITVFTEELFSDYCLHESSIEVKDPEIRNNQFYKDFGFGFYTTRIQKQANRWHNAKVKVMEW